MFIKAFKNYWGIIAVFILCFWAVAALLHPGFFPMHDDEQIARLYDLDVTVKAGQIPPRWMQHLGFGYGFPLFIFYPPFIYYLGDIFHTLGFSLITSTKIVMAMGFFLSGFFMYLWVKNRFSIFAGIIAAVLYIYAPYHALDLYVRGDVAEFFSFVWIPAIFWSIDRITAQIMRMPIQEKGSLRVKYFFLFDKRVSMYIMLSSIFFLFLIITHNLIALAFLPFLGAYLLCLLLINKGKWKQLFVSYSFFFVLGIGLSAFFWLPALAEKQYTLVDTILTGELASYKLHFVYLRQFWNSPWGYGGSVPGPMDGLSFQIGKVQLIVSGIGLIFSIITLFFNKKKSPLSMPLLMVGMFSFSLFMASFYSEKVWNIIPPLWYMQFPWRFLLFATVFSSFLGGYFVYFIQKRFGNIFAGILVFILVSISIFSVISYFQPAKYLTVTDENYTSIQDLEWRVSRMSYEYVPKGVATRYTDVHTTVLAIDQNNLPSQPISIMKGNAVVSIVTNKPQTKQFSIQNATNTLLQVNTFSFPGWKVYVDNKATRFYDNNRLKLITFPVPNGNHTVQVTFEQTPIERLANSISLVTIISIFLGIILIRMRPNS